MDRGLPALFIISPFPKRAQCTSNTCGYLQQRAASSVLPIPQIAIKFRTATDLQLVYALARNGPEHVGGSLSNERVELSGALDEQEARKTERIHAQRLVRDGERVRLVLPREDVHVRERQHDVVRWRAGRVVRRVPHRRDAQVEQVYEGLGQ
jgi:hypothetical protein